MPGMEQLEVGTLLLHCGKKSNAEVACPNDIVAAWVTAQAFLRVWPSAPCHSHILSLSLFWLTVIRVYVCCLWPRTLADPFENNADSCKWEVLGHGSDSALTCHLWKVPHPWALWSCLPNKGSTLMISKGGFEQTFNYTLGQGNGNRRKGKLQDIFYEHIKLGGWLHREGKAESVKDVSVLFNLKGEKKMFAFKSSKATSAFVSCCIHLTKESEFKNTLLFSLLC